HARLSATAGQVVTAVEHAVDTSCPQARRCGTPRPPRDFLIVQGLFAGPPVVGFTRGTAFDSRPEHDRLRKFVAGKSFRGMVDQLAGFGARPVSEGDDSDDFLTPSLTGPSGDNHVCHSGMRCYRRFDLLDEDLF